MGVMRRCERCGTRLKRRRNYKGVYTECTTTWRRRRFCDADCANKTRRRTGPVLGRHQREWTAFGQVVEPHWTVRRGDWWSCTDKVWGPCGPRGEALTRAMYERIESQVEHVLSQPELIAELRETYCVETVLAEVFKRQKQELLYGTLRRVEAAL